ncbi:uncharacterized protein LOC106447149 isoform X1 [Brassica napus]|uniref:uncharacterized protein LOC106447149 isoform X1 n=1 Tax=Brassica napus TaxID=3708 RepID=UPI002078EA4B|nr:uncharacterized protein LOC106447149 isoform X1 [Brassica napus]
MPGNEYGERIHNFFGQEGLSQDQHQSQLVDGSWSSFSNGLVGNQRRIDPSSFASLKSYCSTQQPERWQSSNSHHALNYTQQQPSIRSEYSRGLLQDNQQLTNGYIHGMALQNGSTVLGVGVESSRDNLSAKGFTSDIHKTPMRFEMGGESPVNYDFFGGQQKLNSQPPGMLQPFPRQKMTFNDMQLLKQQVMVKQMHEYQLQQQLHKKQLEARQLNCLNSNAVNGNRSSDNQSHLLINGIPLQDASSNGWQPDLVSGNTHWMHPGISAVSSSGLGAVHGQANLQFEPSLYSMPLGGANAPQNSFTSVQMNRLSSEHGSTLTNQPDSFMLPRSTYQERAMFSNTSAPGSNDSPNFERFQQDDPRQRNVSAQEKLDQMKGSGPPEKSYIKAPGNVSGSQKSTALDPTEEKILFGSDDNLWEAFGNDTDMSLTGNLMSSSSDLNDACPPLKGGGWSALMLSAVAETSSNDAGFGNRVQNLGVKASNALSERLQSDSGSIQTNEGIEDRFGIWKAASNPNLVAPVEQKNHFTQNLQMKANYGFGIATTASRDVQENQQHLGNNSVEKATPQVNYRDGSQISRKFHYHPMGNTGVTDEPYREKVAHLPPTLEQVSAGNQGYFGQPKSLSQPPMNMQIDRGHVLQGIGSENSPTTSASADRSVDMCNQVKNSSGRLCLSFFTRWTSRRSILWKMVVNFVIFSMNYLQPLNSLHITPEKGPTSQKSSNVGSSADGSHNVQSPKQFNMQQMSGSAPGVEIPSSESLPHGATDTLLKVGKPKKRKTATSELLSWNKEVMHGSQRLKTLSEAEVDWARATNQFAEKVEFGNLLEDGLPMRSKRRLIYSTQLMQQLFRPPPARVISLIASSNYEFVAYTAARGALGDACSFTFTDRNECLLPQNKSNPVSERRKTETISDQYISKAAEDFISSSQKLDTNFAGLQNGSTIADLIVEVQDLEKFAVINRFAKFHPTSSSTDRTVSSLRLNPQRHVTIAPMPQNIPDRVQCLSL